MFSLSQCDEEKLNIKNSESECVCEHARLMQQNKYNNRSLKNIYCAGNKTIKNYNKRLQRSSKPKKYGIAMENTDFYCLNIKASLSTTSLSQQKEQQRNCGQNGILAKIKTDRPYHSLKKNIRHRSDCKLNNRKQLYNKRYSWSGGRNYKSNLCASSLNGTTGKDDLWGAIQTNYNYIMDTDLLENCKDTHGEINGVPNLLGNPMDCSKILNVVERNSAASGDAEELRQWLCKMEEKLQKAPTTSEASLYSVTELLRLSQEHALRVTYNYIIQSVKSELNKYKFVENKIKTKQNMSSAHKTVYVRRSSISIDQDFDFEQVLNKVGSFGSYQKYVICFVLLPAALPCAFHAYSQLFIAATPQHWCRVPEMEPWMQDYKSLVKNLTIPNFSTNSDALSKSKQYAECLMFDRNYTDIMRYLEQRTPYDLLISQAGHMVVSDLKNSKLMDCVHGWHFELDMFSSTVVTEWNLVCHKAYFVTLALVVFGAGGLFGNYIFGYLQDIWGRKPSFYTYLILEIIACTGSAFAWNYESWLFMRFIVGWTVPAILSSPYVLAIELVGPQHRVFCTIVLNIAYSCGLVLLACIVYIVRDWRLLSLVVSLPLMLLFSCYCVMPESPRWLVAVGRFREGALILQKIACINGKSVPSEVLAGLCLHQNHHEMPSNVATYGVLDLFRTKQMRRKTCIITLIWFANTSVYVGLSYYAPSIGGDEIWNFFLAGAVELPTYILLWPGLYFFGRRWILCTSMLLGGCGCLLTYFCVQNSNVMLLLYCLGKMGISSAFVVLPLLASELYPTVIRGLGMSFSSVIAMIGPIIIPLINHMGQHMIVLPMLVMGCLLVVGGVASLYLPETRGKHLPQTIEESEKKFVVFSSFL